MILYCITGPEILVIVAAVIKRVGLYFKDVLQAYAQVYVILESFNLIIKIILGVMHASYDLRYIYFHVQF